MTRLGRRSRGSRVLATLTVAAAALTSCSLALATRAPAASDLLWIPAASGSLTGHRDDHLTLRLTGTRDYLTRFTDAPLRQASVVANTHFARRFATDFATADPNAILTYTPIGREIPVSIVLTIGHPRWNAHHHTWTISATRISNQADNLPGAAVQSTSRFGRTRRNFTRATLLIDDSDPCAQGVVRPYENCAGADLAFVNLTRADLTGVNFAGANLTGANLTGANLTGADFRGADLTDSQLSGSDFTGSDLSGEDLTGESFIGADLAEVDLTGANLTGVELPSVDLAFANLTGVNLTDADLSEADLTDADLTDANVNGAEFIGARLCGAIFPGGRIGSDC